MSRSKVNLKSEHSDSTGPHLFSSVHLFAGREFFEGTSHSPVHRETGSRQGESEKITSLYLYHSQHKVLLCLSRPCTVCVQKVKAPYADTSAICLCLRVSHRSSSSSSNTSFILVSPIPLVSNLLESQTCLQTMSLSTRVTGNIFT